MLEPGSHLIISIEEARDILGKVAEKMTDEEIESTIINLGEIARLTIRDIMNGKLKIPPEYKKLG